MAPMANMRDAIVGNMMFFLAVVAAMALLIYVVISRLITEPLTELRASFSRVAEPGARTAEGEMGTPGVFGPAGVIGHGPASASGLPARLPPRGSLDMAERGVLYSSREIDGLIEQYHSMAQRLEELYGSLESQVAERTEQLSSANAEAGVSATPSRGDQRPARPGQPIQVRFPCHCQPRVAHAANLHLGFCRAFG